MNRRIRLAHRPDAGLAATCARVRSMIRPYGTPLGHTASQARHCRQRSQWPSTAAVTVIVSSATARAR